MLEAELAAIFGQLNPSSSKAPASSISMPKPKRKKGKMSAEDRAAIAAAQKARWAKVKAEKM
jgi:hypothetical protein